MISLTGYAAVKYSLCRMLAMECGGTRNCNLSEKKLAHCGSTGAKRKLITFSTYLFDTGSLKNRDGMDGWSKIKGRTAEAARRLDASTVNRTRGPSMATMDFTTKPPMLVVITLIIFSFMILLIARSPLPSAVENFQLHHM